MAHDCISKGDNTIAVWGDSHAARLSSGLRLVFGVDQISQYTRNACPPILDFGQSICRTGNLATIESLRAHKPKLLIMFGAWAFYNPDWSATAPTSLALVKTIDLLKAAGISRILLLGPAPTYAQTLPALIFQKLQADGSTEIPARLLIDVSTVHRVSLQFSEWARKSEVSYFSTVDLFCDSRGCLTVVPGSEIDLVSWDTSHLTTAGAKYLSQAIDLHLQSQQNTDASFAVGLPAAAR
jgi:SGNH domain (fused to AT3 domains)